MESSRHRYFAQLPRMKAACRSTMAIRSSHRGRGSITRVNFNTNRREFLVSHRRSVYKSLSQFGPIPSHFSSMSSLISRRLNANRSKRSPKYSRCTPWREAGYFRPEMQARKGSQANGTLFARTLSPRLSTGAQRAISKLRWIDHASRSVGFSPRSKNGSLIIRGLKPTLQFGDEDLAGVAGFDSPHCFQATGMPRAKRICPAGEVFQVLNRAVARRSRKQT